MQVTEVKVDVGSQSLQTNTCSKKPKTQKPGETTLFQYKEQTDHD